MFQQFAFVVPNQTRIKNLDRINIYKCFIVNLPFRLRTGSFFHLSVTDTMEVSFRNRLKIPHGMPDEDVQNLMLEGNNFRPRDQFYTEALILEKYVNVSAEQKSNFEAFQDSPDDVKLPEVKASYFEALTNLNDAIVGYHHATKSLFGGTVVERLTAPIFFERLRYLHTIVCPDGYQLTQTDLIEIADARGERQFTQVDGQFSYNQLDDVPNEKLDKIRHYTEFNQRFLYYQFALDAKSKMVEQDFVSAILFSVIALEGVHSALLQMCIERRLSSTVIDIDSRARKAESIANRMLREVGLTEMLEMTSMLFLDDTYKPVNEDITKCKIGIKIRNEIMHALAKKGQYRLRNRTNQQICEAYSDVLKLFDHFASVVERMMDDASTA